MEHEDSQVEVKLSLCFNWPPRHKGVLGVEVQLHAFLISTLDECKWSASSPAVLPPGKEPLVPIG